ncbi:hypothetical protein C6A36_02590, partial [Desulfobacteraceae bacterium SEEP-SAG10]
MAHEHLLSFKSVGVDERMIDEHLNHWKQGKRNSINDLLLGMLNSVQNKQGWWRAIGNLENLRPYLENFAPRLIVGKYGSNCKDGGRRLFDAIKEGYTP